MSSRLSGDLIVNLHLTTDLGSACVPSLSTELRMDWHVDGAPGAPVSSSGEVPTLRFENAALGPGSFSQSFVLRVGEHP